MNKKILKDDVKFFLKKQEKITGIYCESDYILGVKIWNLAVKKIAKSFNQEEILSFLIKHQAK